MPILKLRSGKTLEVAREIARPIHEKWTQYKLEQSESRRKQLGGMPIFIGTVTFELADVKFFDMDDFNKPTGKPFAAIIDNYEEGMDRMRALAADQKADVLLGGAAILFLYTRGAPYVVKTDTGFSINEPERTLIRVRLLQFFSDPKNHNKFFLPREAISEVVDVSKKSIEIIRKIPAAVLTEATV